MAKGFKGLVEGGASFAQGVKAVAGEGVKLGKGTAGVGGNIVTGTASASTGLVGRILGGAGSFMKAHPKISFVVGLYAALKGVQHIFRKRKENAALQDTQQQAPQFQPYGAEPAVNPYADLPQQGQGFSQQEPSQADMVKQVLDALSAAGERQGAAPQVQAEQPGASFADRVRPNGAQEQSSQWAQTVDASRQAQQNNGWQK